jgi:hypothetical protein
VIFRAPGTRPGQANQLETSVVRPTRAARSNCDPCGAAASTEPLPLQAANIIQRGFLLPSLRFPHVSFPPFPSSAIHPAFEDILPVIHQNNLTQTASIFGVRYLVLCLPTNILCFRLRTTIFACFIYCQIKTRMRPCNARFATIPYRN